MMEHTPVAPSWPVFTAAQINAVTEVINSGKVNYWTGPHGRAFEAELAKCFEVKHAIATANGTLALELCLFGLGVRPGDEVIVPARTFIASASAIVARGAQPVIVDVEAESQGLSLGSVQANITSKTKAVIAVHLGGWPCDIAALQRVCGPRQISIVEDCAQAHGARIGGKPVGSLGTVAALSFCQDKIITTLGEGGAVLTNDSKLYERMWSYKDHGKNRLATATSGGNGANFRWLHESFGTNMRMTEVQSVVGRHALWALSGWVARRQEIAAALRSVCQMHNGISVPVPPRNVQPAFYKFYFFVREEMLGRGWTREKIIEGLRSYGISCGVGSCGEIWREKAFPQAWRPHEPLAVAKRLAEESVAISISPNWTESYLGYVCGRLDSVLTSANSGRCFFAAA